MPDVWWIWELDYKDQNYHAIEISSSQSNCEIVHCSDKG